MMITSFCQVLWESGVDAHACHTLKLMNDVNSIKNTHYNNYNHYYFSLTPPSLYFIYNATYVKQGEKKRFLLGAICLFA